VRPEGSDKIVQNKGKGRKRSASGRRRGDDGDGTDQSPEKKTGKKEMMEVVFVVTDNIEDEDSEVRGRSSKKKGDLYAVIRPVETGISSETHYEILSGLEEGEEIVVGGYRAISRELKHQSVIEAESSEGEEADDDQEMEEDETSDDNEE
jgi:hypothetical protein